MKQQTIVLKKQWRDKSFISSFPWKSAILRLKDERSRWHSLNFEYDTILPAEKIQLTKG